jgi:hypothetical protein
MDNDTMQKLVKMMQSENDADAVMGLRGFQALLKGEEVDFAKAISFVGENISNLKEKKPLSAEALTQAAQPRAKLQVSGMPQCVIAQPGVLMIIPPGQETGETVPLPGAAAAACDDVAAGLKDVLVAAAINKSRFKLKVLDVKDKYGDVAETILQAEYDRDGMSPIKVWGNVKGEVAALATVLRRAVSSSMPDMVA